MDKPVKPEKIAIKAKRESAPQSAARSDLSPLSVEHTSMFFAVLADLQRSFGRVEAKVEGLGDRIGRVEESIQEWREELRGEIKEVREELGGEIKEVRADLYKLDKRADQSTNQLDKRIDHSAHQLDQRIDDSIHQLDKRIDESTNQLDKRIDESTHQLDKRVDDISHRLDKRIDHLSWWVVYGGGLLTLLTLAGLVWLLPDPIRGFIMGLIGK
jgi:DNA repair ATPase RecN